MQKYTQQQTTGEKEKKNENSHPSKNESEGKEKQEEEAIIQSSRRRSPKYLSTQEPSRSSR